MALKARDKTPSEWLTTPAQYLPGVGPRRVELLAKLGLLTAKDVLFFFPRDYQDLTDLRTIHELEEGKLVSVRGVVDDFELRNTGTGKSILGVLIRQDSEYLRAVWFNMPFMREHFTRGQQVLLSGTAKYVGGRWEMAHPRVQSLDGQDEAPLGKILPVYPLTEGLKQGDLRRIVRGTIELCLDALDEAFPVEYLQEHDLWPLRKALPQVHFPDDQESLAAARRRLIYQELFVLQLALAVKRMQSREVAAAPTLTPTARIDARIRRLLPFALTPGQDAVIGEIAADMARTTPMNRLLQGDVGSGKTIVAVYAMLLAVAHGYQAVLMAPTEVLARQHYQTLFGLLANSHVRMGLLVGGQSASERRKLEDNIAAGHVNLVVGTQALVCSEVSFPRLGLVVIDEQHKFGVRQRALLKAAGASPHYLVMTATPIPRTVAMTQFGDLDVSTLREMPPGRQKVNTYLVRPAERERWWEFLRKKLREGRQAYVIAPLVDEPNDRQVASVQELYEALVNGELEAFRVGLVHGRMSPAEKDATMDAFRRGELQVLVATSVVEVGVDVPNATIMTIEDAQQFGLAQLHQLRGRISRGKFPGFCGVFADPQNEEAKARLDALVKSSDGFHLAEVDFAIRGPGELLGTRQHGVAPLRIADLVRDRVVLEEARRDAQDLVAVDPALSRPEWSRMKKQMLARYGQALELGDVG